MLTIIFVILIGGFIFEALLDFLNIKNWSPEVPVVMKDVFSDEKYKIARNYSMVNYRLSTLSSFFSLCIPSISFPLTLSSSVRMHSWRCHRRWT